jgi:uncharacterized protein (TIGR02265 family)
VKIKGSVLKARLAFVADHAPEGGVERVLGAMAPEDRAALQGILATRWYPFDIGRRLDEAIARELAKGDPRFFEKLGEASAEKNLAGVHREFLVKGDPQAFLARAPMIYSFYYDTGRREHRPAGPKEAVLTTYDAETFSGADCLTVVGWHRKALEMCGATGVEVVEEECRARGGKVCRYRLSWA